VRLEDDTGGLDGTLISEAKSLELETFTLELSDPVGTTATLEGVDSGATFAGRCTIVEARE